MVKHNYEVTVSIPKHPKQFTANEEVMVHLLNMCGNVIDYQWELNRCCQLHVHAHVSSKSTLYVQKLLSTLKKEYPDYRMFIEKLSTSEDVSRWCSYINKHKMDKVIEIYYRIILFYRDKTYKEDFSELADLDIEFNSNTGHFVHLEQKGVWFNDIE